MIEDDDGAGFERSCPLFTGAVPLPMSVSPPLLPDRIPCRPRFRRWRLWRKNTLMNTHHYAHLLTHRHTARALQRQAQHQRIHRELRTTEARSLSNRLHRLARIASLFL